MSYTDFLLLCGALSLVEDHKMYYDTMFRMSFWHVVCLGSSKINDRFGFRLFYLFQVFLAALFCFAGLFRNDTDTDMVPRY